MLRILYNSRDPSHKDPLGTIIPGQTCTLRMKIPPALPNPAGPVPPFAGGQDAPHGDPYGLSDSSAAL